MLSWVVKVVPQPPESPPKNVEEPKAEKPAAAPPPDAAPPPPPAPEKKVTFQDASSKEAPKVEKPKQDAQAAEGNGPASGSQSGMLTWISGALPVPSPKQSRASSSKEETATSNPEDEKGMIAWIAQGMQKVVPQPDLKSKEQLAAEQPTEQPPEKPAEVPQVCQTVAAPAAEPPVPPAAVESDPEDKADKPFPPRMMEWLKHGIEMVVPKPEIHAQSKTDGAADSAKAEGGPATAETENMMGWIVSEIGRILPQPVQKQDSGGDDVQSISIGRKSDLVLEDVELDGETETKKTEDAGEQCTLLMDRIKKEAQMEERLQQERLEAARIAEDMARKAAEEAVRQLEEVEHSAMIAMETLPESNEQLPNILEEENEDDPELQNLQEDSEDSTDNRSPEENKVAEENNKSNVDKERKPDQSLLDVCPAEGDADPPSTEAQPASDRRDPESPITQQPEPQAPEAPPATDQDNKAAEEGGSGVPDICSPIKSFLLRIPHAAECLESCRQLMHDNYLTPPKLSMPAPPPELALLTQELSQLPKQARQGCMSIVSRFRRLTSNSQHPEEP